MSQQFILSQYSHCLNVAIWFFCEDGRKETASACSASAVSNCYSALILFFNRKRIRSKPAVSFCSRNLQRDLFISVRFDFHGVTAGLQGI